NNTDPSLGALFLYYPAAAFDPFPTNFFGGVRVATAYINTPPPTGSTQPTSPTSTATEDIIVVPGITGVPQIKVFLGQSVAETLPPAPLPTFTPSPLNNFNSTTNTGFPFLAYGSTQSTGVQLG